MARVNILKQVKVGERWKLVSIPRDPHGRSNWKALPDGRYFIEWWEHGKRKRQAAGATTADALEAARRRKHILEGRALGFEDQAAAEELRRTPLHVGLKRYLEVVEGLKKLTAFWISSPTEPPPRASRPMISTTSWCTSKRSTTSTTTA